MIGVMIIVHLIVMENVLEFKNQWEVYVDAILQLIHNKTSH